MVKKAAAFYKEHGREKALAELYTGESLAPFYSRFGFAPAFGMSRRIHREEE